ncbi:2OG-Fe dioxygenase family protein [Humitalea sp. 24SJ18S-53]|uniref:2OG-Fe dioxygenase family protein n=1 Tax=Humitalea sp. 24SJ18S-53 TaxID=3422307 RepID=UPI003D679110
MSAVRKAPPSALAALTEQGFYRIAPLEMAGLLGATATPTALADFAASWSRLETDGFMADGGRYRRRRHANFAAVAGVPGQRRGEHRPHFQASVHNSLNGGVDRWFAPVEAAVGDSAVLGALLELGRGAADTLFGARDWFTEMHQFRIEAAAGLPGYPTPEGVHQDGVDLVIIAMIARTNLTGGETVVAALDGRPLAQFTLDGMLDTAVLDDTRVRHGVSPIAPTDPTLPSCRDVLVLTWKRV